MPDPIASVKLDACQTGNIHHSYVAFKYSKNHMHRRFKYPFPNYTLPTNFRKEKKRSSISFAKGALSSTTKPLNEI